MRLHSIVASSSIGVFALACSSNGTTPTNDAGSSASCAAPGGPVSGAPDTHCTSARATDVSVCNASVDAGPPELDDAGLPVSDYGGTLSGTEGDDDDCKYHVSWSSTPLCENGNVTFTVKATKKTDGTALTGAGPYADIFLNDKHPAPPTDQKFVETSPGTYTIGPVAFDAPGKWTVRFHFYGNCQDVTEDSPHGHAAFFVQLP